MPPADIPQELIDLIVDHFHTDRDALRQCSYVSESFLVSCRRHLFAHIELTSACQCERLYAILSSRPEIVPTIRQLCVTHKCCDETSYVAILWILTDSGTLEMFHFDGRSSYVDSTFRDFGLYTAHHLPHRSAMKELLKSARLKIITLLGVHLCSFPMDLLVVTPMLHHLSFTGKCDHFCDTSQLHTPNSLSSLPSSELYLLTISSDYSDLLMPYLWDRLSQLHSLRLMRTRSTPPFQGNAVDLRLLQNLRLLVLEFAYKLDSLPEILAASGIPRSIEYLVVVTLVIFFYSHVNTDEKLAEILSSVDAYPRLQGVHVLPHLHDGYPFWDNQEPYRTKFELAFGHSAGGGRAGLFQVKIVHEGDVEANLEDLKMTSTTTPQGRRSGGFLEPFMGNFR